MRTNGPRGVIVGIVALAEGLVPRAAEGSRPPKAIRELQEAIEKAKAWADEDGWDPGDRTLALVSAAADLVSAADDRWTVSGDGEDLELVRFDLHGFGADLEDVRDTLVEHGDRLEEAIDAWADGDVQDEDEDDDGADGES